MQNCCWDCSRSTLPPLWLSAANYSQGYQSVQHLVGSWLRATGTCFTPNIFAIRQSLQLIIWCCQFSWCRFLISGLPNGFLGIALNWTFFLLRELSGESIQKPFCAVTLWARLGKNTNPYVDIQLQVWSMGEILMEAMFLTYFFFRYLAPEYFMHGIVTEKTDVFAFGVLLLELITGRQPIDEHQLNLVMWVCNCSTLLFLQAM